MRTPSLKFLVKLLCFSVLFSVAWMHSAAADSAPHVTLNTSKAVPRQVEPLTERAVLRDYKFAWTNLTQALTSNSLEPLNGLFEATADSWLTDAVKDQQRTGLSTRYLNQNHKVDAVFYSPEGDVIELHDTADYDLEILDGGKTIHNEHATVHYVVLMIPGAERWVIRHLQAVPQF
jgi:hypothetical protein